VAPVLLSNLLDTMKVQPFSLSIDGSNDSDLRKMYPITVRIYDKNCSTIVTRFLDMCITTDGTAIGIYEAMNA